MLFRKIKQIKHFKKIKKRNCKQLLITQRKIRKIIFIFFLFCISLLKNPFFNYHMKSIILSDKYRLAVIFGTRPEAIKLIPLIKELKSKEIFNCITINTGQHREMTHQILKSFQMDKSIDFDLNIMEKNQSLTKLTSKIILELEKIIL